MRWSKTIAFAQPLRKVVLAGPADRERRQHEREEQAYARGLEEAERRLQGQLLQQRRELVELQNGVLHSLRNAVVQAVRAAEQTLIDYALEVAQKIVAEIPIDRKLIEANVRSALAQVEDTTEFFIHLHPEDLTLLQQQGSDLMAESPHARTLHWVPSAEIGRGGCLVRTEFGFVDARRETRLELIQESRSP